MRRVLKDDGTVWLNLGDSYAGNSKPGGGDPTIMVRNLGGNDYRKKEVPLGLKPKDLVGIPWRVAFALQADGWYLRQDIIWHKPNPMPESVTDRCTKAHEYIFLLSKNKKYYYDHEAVKENSISPSGTAGTWNGNRDFGLPGGQSRFGKPNLGGSIDGNRNKRSVWSINTQPFTGWLETSHLSRVGLGEVSYGMKHIVSPDCPIHGDLFDSVASSFCGEHEADFLNHIKRIYSHHVLKRVGGSSPIEKPPYVDYEVDNLGCSPPTYSPFAIVHNIQNHKRAPFLDSTFSCMPYVETLSRIDDKRELLLSFLHHLYISENNISLDGTDARLLDQIPHCIVDKSSLPIPPECLCSFYQIKTKSSSHFATFPPKLIEPCILAGSKKGDIILDPFSGAGTTAVMAGKHKRQWIGIELNEDYLAIAKKRIKRETRQLTITD